MTDPDKAARLAALEAKIAAAKGADTPKPHTEEHYSQAQHAWRMVTELVAGLGIGFGIGYGLDALFGTMPLFLVIFILLGFAAGVKTMMRSAQEVQSKQMAKAAADDDKARSGKDEGA
ncbi:AtpZ/AtpI family protein [Litorivita sp. NS0012-18]|uniref:AtpZ/AtpI family protein n=1 Tax=Litorivita sp. NS0012-18 TaxID=3127655 RepID=UPI00310602A5